MHSQLCCHLKKAGAHVILQSVRISAQGSIRINHIDPILEQIFAINILENSHVPAIFDITK